VISQLATPRLGLSTIIALSTLAGAAVGAVLTGQAIGSVNASIETVSGSSGSLLGSIANAIPLGYAFGAGMVAAVNPCGFALLPGYLALYLGGEGTESAARSTPRQLWNAVSVGIAMTLGFILMFGLAGAALSVAASALARYLPWLGLGMGVLVVVFGSQLLSGRGPYSRLGDRIADRLSVGSRHRDARGYFVYGLAYAATSLSCTLPIFLAVVAGALATSGPIAAFIQLSVYALGMGFVIVVLTASMALVKVTVVTRVRQLMPNLQPVSAVFVLLAGAYIVYYWLTLGGILATLLRA
jgi:cytochrome c-type biogenesis protein